MLVRNILKRKSREVVTTGPSASIDEAMDVLIKNKISCLPVLDDDGKLVGVISDHDIFAEIHRTRGDYHSLKVEDLMTTALIIGLPDDDINYIANVMEQNWIRHVPIVEGERLVGIVSQRDIMIAQSQHIEIENRFLRQHLDGLHMRDKSADF